MLSNSYLNLPEMFYHKTKPEKFMTPKLLVFNHVLAQELGLDLNQCSDEQIALYFSGQKLLPGSEPIALVYAGFQFGHPVAELGDGRAHLLGEINGYDIQLKGSGRTVFSRRGDGRSALGPVLREYVVSEAMHNLGVSTTRALCAISTGEEVYRQDGSEPGGVFTRVAQGHLRVGTFQYFAFKQDFDSLKLLLNYTLNRHYPKIKNDLPLKEKCLALLTNLTHKQIDLVASWSSFGFIHGVMNTDNFSLAGITIDYGPCAFMDEFKFNKVFSSIDRHGRYAFFNQVPIAKWNILRLADCLLPLIDEKEDKAVGLVESVLAPLFERFEVKRMELFAKKIGINNFQDNDEKIIMEFLNYLEENTLDFTLSFRNLPELFNGEYHYFTKTEKLAAWVEAWKKRVSDISGLHKINPIYIPRNHQIQKAIEMAYDGDYSHFHKLNEVLKNPFEQKDEFSEFAKAPELSERVCQTFCGT